jgi:hypothetical protein
MWWPAVRIFRLSPLDKEQDARHLASGRAAIALGRKVLTENPRPGIAEIPHDVTKQRPLRQPDGDPTRSAVDRRTKANRDQQSLERRHLIIADEHVAKAERVVLEQAAALESFRRDGYDTRLAEDAMTVFEANLQVMREHRELILRAIEYTDDSP